MEKLILEILLALCAFVKPSMDESSQTECGLHPVKSNHTKYTMKLWGKSITRSCEAGQRFDSKACNCVESPEPSGIRGGIRYSIVHAGWALSIKPYQLISIPGVAGSIWRSWVDMDGHCGGALIHIRWALTVKHCVAEKTVDPITNFVAYTLNLTQACCGCVSGCSKQHCYTKSYNRAELKLWDVNRITVEGGTEKKGEGTAAANVLNIYGDPASNIDMVLLHLDHQLEQAYHEIYLPVVSVNVAPPDVDFYDSTDCYIVGFGDQTPGQSDGYLHGGNVRLVDFDECLNEIPDFGYYSASNWMICARDQHDTGLATCKGDSGGGMVCRHPFGGQWLLGILVLGDPTCAPDKPSVYASTQYFHNIISQHVPGYQDGGQRK